MSQSNIVCIEHGPTAMDGAAECGACAVVSARLWDTLETDFAPACVFFRNHRLKMLVVRAEKFRKTLGLSSDDGRLYLYNADGTVFVPGKDRE